jgi:hypothetical protein
MVDTSNSRSARTLMAGGEKRRISSEHAIDKIFEDPKPVTKAYLLQDHSDLAISEPDLISCGSAHLIAMETCGFLPGAVPSRKYCHFLDIFRHEPAYPKTVVIDEEIPA